MTTNPWVFWRRSTLAVLCLAAPVLAAEHGGAEETTLFTGDLGNILWTLITFVIVLVLLGKFAWGPILGALQKREEFIRDSLDQARKDREAAEERLREYTEQLQAARDEASSIVDEGRRDAVVLKEKIESNARAEAEALVERAKREISIAKESAVKELYGLSAKIATDAASRIIRKELSPHDHERLIAESIAELGGTGGNGASRN